MLLFHMLAHWQNHLDKLTCQELKFCEFGYYRQLIEKYLHRWKYRKIRHYHQLQSKNISQVVHFSASSTHFPPNKSGPVPSLHQKTCNLKNPFKNDLSPDPKFRATKPPKQGLADRPFIPVLIYNIYYHFSLCTYLLESVWLVPDHERPGPPGQQKPVKAGLA